MSKWINIDDLPNGRVEWDDIVDAPSIDIVRCAECVYADKYYHCNYMTTWNNADDYCSRGERKESE